MKSENNQATERAELRNLAEKRLKVSNETTWQGSTVEAQRQDHELQVHQIELVMQNEELRQAQSELSISLERYTDLYDFAPIGYFSINAEGFVLEANLTGCMLLGVERSFLIGKRFALWVADAAKSDFAAFLGRLSGSKEKMSCEMKLLRGEDESFFARVDWKFADECRIAVIDISEQVRARVELQEENAKRQRAMEELIEQKEMLLIHQSRLAAMGEMIGHIAHQWRQPLNTLGLEVQMLLQFYDIETFNREFLENGVNKSMELISHMSKTIDDFRNYLKPDNKKLDFNVHDAVKITLSLMEGSLKYQRISIQIDVKDDAVIYGHQNEFAQVILNILINAKDALIERKIVEPRVLITIGTEENRTFVTIADNAGGISRQSIDKIFEPYFTTKGPQDGTGLGLSMSKAIIENSMGGCLSVRNVVGGAEFRIEVVKSH